MQEHQIHFKTAPSPEALGSEDKAQLFGGKVFIQFRKQQRTIARNAQRPKIIPVSQVRRRMMRSEIAGKLGKHRLRLGKAIRPQAQCMEIAGRSGCGFLFRPIQRAERAVATRQVQRFLAR